MVVLALAVGLVLQQRLVETSDKMRVKSVSSRRRKSLPVVFHADDHLSSVLPPRHYSAWVEVLTFVSGRLRPGTVGHSFALGVVVEDQSRARAPSPALVYFQRLPIFCHVCRSAAYPSAAHQVDAFGLPAFLSFSGRLQFSSVRTVPVLVVTVWTRFVHSFMGPTLRHQRCLSGAPRTDHPQAEPRSQKLPNEHHQLRAPTCWSSLTRI